MKSINLIAALLLIPLLTSAQYFINGQEAPHTKWRQIETPNYKIVYPLEFEKESQRLANLMESSLRLINQSDEEVFNSIPLIVHPFTSTSNAMVAWAPRRMEFYTSPNQEGDNMEWFTLLALHENRHFIQFERMKKYGGLFSSILLGQQGNALMLGLCVPLWFVEGEAVVRETAHSNAGRGRNPAFTQLLKAQVLKEGIYSYNKAMFGSYKDYVPDHYALGYHLVSKIEQDYGQVFEEMYKNVGHGYFVNEIKQFLQDKKRFSEIPIYEMIPFFPRTLSRSSKLTIGNRLSKVYKNSLSSLKQEWEKDFEKKSFSKYQVLNPEKEHYSNYNNVYPITENTYLALKNSIDHTNRFVIIKDGIEEKLFQPGFVQPGSPSFANNLLVWTENRSHIRYGNISWSEIHSYDLSTQKHKILTPKKRYFAPDLSKDGTMIACIENTDDYGQNIVILDASNGTQIASHKIEKPIYPYLPVWGANNDAIYFIAIQHDKKSIYCLDLTNNSYEAISPWTDAGIKDLYATEKGLYFSGAFDQSANIYYWDFSTKELSQITETKYSAKQLSLTPNSENIIYSNYGAMGYDVALAKNIPIKKIEFPSKAKIPVADFLTKEKGGVLTEDKIDKIKYESQEYSRSKNLINIHSWSPFAIQASTENTLPGISFISQNELGTAITAAGYKINPDNNGGAFYADILYSRLFPEFNIGGSIGSRGIFKENGDLETIIITKQTYLGIKLPLNLTRNNFYKMIQPQAELTYMKNNYHPQNDDPTSSIDVGLYSFGLYGHILQRSSKKDIKTQLGGIFNLGYTSKAKGSYNAGNIKYATGILYLPGIMKHHSFSITGAYQFTNNLKQFYGNNIVTTRGTTPYYSKQITSLQTNYRFPLYYPDWNLGIFAYIMRIHANAFFDYSFYNNIINNETWTNKNKNIQSYGFDLMADMHLFRFVAPIRLGIRTAVVNNLTDNKNAVKVMPIMEINFYDLY